MNSKKVSISAVLIFILVMLAVSFFILLRWQETRERKRISAYNSALLFYQEGKYTEAIVPLKQIVERYSRNEETREAYYYLVSSLAELKEYKEAESYAQKFLRDFPKGDYIDKIYYQTAWLLELQGKADEALASYAKVITDFPDGDMVDDAVLGQGRVLMGKGEVKSSWETFQRVIDQFPESNSFFEAREKLGEINMKVIFSTTIADKEDSIVYNVQSGDSLYSIARKFRTTVALLVKSNKLRDAAIRPGKTLKITPGHYRILIDKSDCILSLYLKDRLIKVYPVGVGIEDYYTPTGEFKIVEKQENPYWRSLPPGHPDNILGSRWMAISEPGYGIHGTTKPETIGKKSSQGCIRMLNKDVEELFDLVVEETPVVIEE